MKGYLMPIAQNITELIGNTPLIQLHTIAMPLQATVLAKLEYFNPGGSVKDRIARQMIEDAEKNGQLNSNTVIIEPTSGNTGIALAMIAAAKGYQLTLTMPDTMSIERRKLLSSYGATLILTPGAQGMKGAINKANELHEQTENSIMLNQFANKSNPKAHYETTANELWESTEGNIDILVSGVGTGGTITGVANALKNKKPSFQAIAVEPIGSPVLSGGAPGPHKIQGIGAGFIPDILDQHIIDDIIQVDHNDAFAMSRRLAKEEGILAGISSGANIWAALQVASKEENKGKTIVTVICDTGERYLSTALFE